VFDFSLGNPNVPPPEIVKSTLLQLVQELAPGMHGYMPNAGLPETRSAVAGRLSLEKGISLRPDHVIMTCGAAGGLNIILKALLNPGEEVLVPRPTLWIRFLCGQPRRGAEVGSHPPGFHSEHRCHRGGISPRTKVLLINSPNNPTGQIYSSASLSELARLLTEKSREYRQAIYLVSDEPYCKIVYDGHQVPSIFSHYPDSLITTSYSKDLSIPGERLGFVAVHPEAEDVAALLGGLTLATAFWAL